MASLRVRWGHINGGNERFLLQHSRPFSKQLISKKLIMDPKYSSQQQMAEAHCLSVVVRLQGMNKSSDSSGFSTCRDWNWREMSNVHPNESFVDEENEISEKLDQWVRDSVVEIVSNVGEAPFLVHIHTDSDDGKGSSSTNTVRLVREKAVADSWPLIRGRWEGGSPAPSGIILVEELKTNDLGTKRNSLAHSTDKVWGVLIQGKGVNWTACACYILKTCRVESLLGFCTHFCLLRVECFAESAETQLKKLWLQS
ncbi:hypothetical protein F0562_000938 [Nyssa sinensis]|uniref:DUF7804 domain-containing protein n=1 Tax=Nyssa sinensis TaxID=561372 RepID=A0A5J5C379_9ASTE|nr:hypothetical protein F0562_000938 [Nyssa sinensis]